MTPSLDTISASGDDWLHAWARLRSVYPKAKQASATDVTLWASAANAVTIGLPGGESSIHDVTAAPAPFAVLVPFKFFADLMKNDCREGKPFALQFAPGVIHINAMQVAEPGIRLRSVGAESRTSVQSHAAALPVAERPLDMLEHQPLGAIYCHFQFKAPHATPRSVSLIKSMTDARARLERAAKTLEPLGITRDDLDSILQSRFSPG